MQITNDAIHGCTSVNKNSETKNEKEVNELETQAAKFFECTDENECVALASNIQENECENSEGKDKKHGKGVIKGIVDGITDVFRTLFPKFTAKMDKEKNSKK